MTPNRRITPLTLATVERMATDPGTTPALRQFHAARLADLRARAARQVEPVRGGGNPFDRFIEKLETIEN